MIKDNDIEFEFSTEKNIKLKRERNISFEEIIYYINNGHLLDIIQHPNKDKYNGQQFYVLHITEYIYLVPFVQNKNKIFLKTIFPSRKHTRQYLEERNNSGDINHE